VGLIRFMVAIGSKFYSVFVFMNGGLNYSGIASISGGKTCFVASMVQIQMGHYHFLLSFTYIELMDKTTYLNHCIYAY
jgi:hypothetical protein